MPTCRHCGFEAGAETGACPLCGSDLPGGGGGDAARPAWEEAERPAVSRLLETWRESLFRPTPFFRSVRGGTGLAAPLLYYLLVTVAGAFFTLWWELVGIGPGAWPPGGDELSRGARAVIGFFVSPFAALLGLAVWTLVLHLFVLLLVPARASVGATARVVCYAAGPSVFSAAPILGPMVGVVWTIVLQVVGVREVHRASTGRAAAAVLLPLGLAALVLLAVALLLVVVAGAALLDLRG